ncbi:MAG: chemotaxis protein CheW [Bdellovibrionota bacterium]
MKLQTERFLTFYLDSYLCAFKVSDIKEINHPLDDFHASDSRATLRDESIPFYDLRPRLGLESVRTTDARIIVLKSQSGLKTTLVDRVHAVVDLYADQWETVTEKDALPIASDSIFIGIASWKGLSVLLLDPLKLFENSRNQIIAS